MTKNLLPSAIVGLLILLAPQVSQADHNGCMVIGNSGPFLSTCKYVAPDDSQDVIVASPNLWWIEVVRENCPVWEVGCAPDLEDGCQPTPENVCEPRRTEDGEIVTQKRSVRLLEGEGTPVGPPPTVHPRPGETVHVTLDRTWFHDLAGVEGAFEGVYGFISVGQTDGHP